MDVVVHSACIFHRENLISSILDKMVFNEFIETLRGCINAKMTSSYFMYMARSFTVDHAHVLENLQVSTSTKDNRCKTIITKSKDWKNAENISEVR